MHIDGTVKAVLRLDENLERPPHKQAANRARMKAQERTHALVHARWPANVLMHIFTLSIHVHGMHGRRRSPRKNKEYGTEARHDGVAVNVN